MKTERSRLTIASELAILLCAVAYLGRSAQEYVAATAHAASHGSTAPLEQSAYTDTVAAHVTLTNLNAFTIETCLRGVVSPQKGNGVQSIVVCTGELKPRTTVELVAPYPAGAVLDICGNDQAGLLHSVDWDRCTFTLVRVD